VTTNRRPAPIPVTIQLQRAFDCLQRGERTAAEAHCAALLKQQPEHPEALHLMGLLALQGKRLRKAVQLIGKSLALQPGNAVAHSNHAAALQALGDLPGALASYNNAIVYDPRFVEAHFNRGIVLGQLDRPQEAVDSFSRAVTLCPDFAAAYEQRGAALQRLEQWDAALASYDQALAHAPHNADVCVNRGVVLRALKRPQDALGSYERALALDPRHVPAHVNRGNVLRQLERWDEALASYQRALDVRPDCAEALCHRGNVYNETNRLDLAIAAYDAALALAPQYVEARCNRAVAHLLAGRLEQGWIDYEWRRKLRPRAFAVPLWRGRESLAGKTVLLHGEQGFGDTLQFCRYAPAVAALGARVILEVQAPLVTLLGSLDGVTAVLAQADALPPVDYHCPLMSLPFAFKTTLPSIPASPSYLTADTTKIAHWRAALGVAALPRIGLVWSGSDVENNNRRLRLADLIEFLPESYEYVCLQREICAEDAALLARHPRIREVSAHLHDFSDTAALCATLDRVVSIDTGVAHLAAALGRPTAILLPFSPDWRWLLERSDSPWYPSVTLYRQAQLGDWSAALAGLRDSLLARDPLLARRHLPPPR